MGSDSDATDGSESHSLQHIYATWRDWPNLPTGWLSADPPNHVVTDRVKDAAVLTILRRALAGKWQKVYRRGKDGTELHYFEHESGRVALVQLVRR